jgi:hypothetical protein
MSFGFVALMMVGGAIGFYLGIDLPPRDRSAAPGQPPAPGLDPVEVLSALGTFLAPVAALVSVVSIILDIDTRPAWALAIGLGWLAGVAMQIVAGLTARFTR